MTRARTVCATAAAIVAAVAAGAATGAAGSGAAIRPNVGIGAVRLSMTRVQVDAALGKAGYVVKREPRGFGSHYVEVQWRDGAWTVGLQGRPGRLRAVKVATTVAAHRVRRVGPGSGVGAVVGAFPAVHCLDMWLTHRAPNTFVPSTFQGRWLIVGAPGSRHTAFVVGYRFDSTNSAGKPPPGRVYEVVVQQPAPPGKVISTECAAGWRHDAVPARPRRYGPP